jgi:predicted PurR-regulated permease PerM
MTHDKHLWEFRWVRDLAILIAAALLLMLIYQVRAIAAPIVVGFGLAYVFNPLVKWLHESKRWPRWAGSVTVMATAAVIVLGVLLITVPMLVDQTGELIRKLHGYAQWALEQAAPHIEQASQAAQQRMSDDQAQLIDQLRNIDLTTVRNVIFKALDLGVGAVGAVGEAFGLLTYMSLAAVIIAFCFFFFSWKFDAIIDWFKPLVPKSAQATTFDVIAKMDRCIAAFIRGRLIQSLVMGLVLSIGWKFAGVPYWLLLGMGCGVLNLIPFAAVFGCGIALILAVVDHLSGGANWSWMVLVWPAVVYLVAQSLDGWVVEPLVQGQATNLDPLTVMLVVIVGGSLAGLLGMLLAIPVAACVKIACQEVLLPKWRKFAESA